MNISSKQLNDLYIKKHLSTPEIAKKLNCSEHKINYWIKEYKIPKRTISEAIYAKYNPDGNPFKIKNKLNKKEAELRGMGMGIYWGEGNKKNKTAVRVGNSDPRLLKKFRKFLIKICQVKKERIKYSLLLFNDADKEKAISFWKKELKINDDQLKSITSLKSRGEGTYKEKSMTGVLIIQVNNTKFKEEIDKMFELL